MTRQLNTGWKSPRRALTYHDYVSAASIMRQTQAIDFAVLRRRLVACAMEVEETEIKRMLSCWVSECEPVVVYQDGTLAGLGLAGDPELRLIVEAQGARRAWFDLYGRHAADPALLWRSRSL
jgi:hypothetical protein